MNRMPIREDLGKKLIEASKKVDGITHVQQLMDAGADINFQDGAGNSPLHWACNNGCDDIAVMLTERGANISALNKNKHTPLQLCNTTFSDVLTALATPKYDITTARSEWDLASLLEACKAGDVRKVVSLLEKWPNLVNSFDADGKTPLAQSCESDRFEVVSVILQKGGDVNLRDKYGRHPIHFACYAGHTTVASMLIEKGSDIEAITDIRDRPLHSACYNNRLATIKFLLDRNCNYNAKNHFGENPLHIACKRGHQDLAMKLLEIGVDSTSTDENGQTPFDMCISHKTRFNLERKLNEITEAKRAEANQAARDRAATEIARNAAEKQLAEAKLLAEQYAEAKAREEKRFCISCNELEPLTGGAMCTAAGDGHFSCNTCIDGQTRAVSESWFGKRGGINCCGYECKCLYSERVLAQACSAEVHAIYETAKKNQVEAKVSSEIQRDYEMRLEVERLRIQNSSIEEQHLCQSRRYIQEEILTIKCPRCKKAFVEFTNCFAISCTDDKGNGCNAGFCAFCLELCGNDAHAHVANCPMNINPGKNVYAPEGKAKEVFQRAQKIRCAAAVKEYLARMKPAERKNVLKGCKQDMDELGIKSSDFK